MKWTKRLSRYTLPGMGLNWDASYFGLLFLAMVLVVLYTFLHDYQAALRALYVYRYGTQILRQGAVMPTLNTLLRHKFTVFWAYTTFCALRAFANYRSFFTETKSIYLMKRLKDPNELRRRCIAIPAAACGAALVLFLLLRKFLYKPVMNIIAQRQKQVDDALNAAETSKQEAVAALNDAQAKLRNVDAEAVARRTAYEQQAEKDKQQLLADAQKQADAILAEGKAAAEAERQHKLRQADAQTTALARAMCEKLLARSLNEQDDARLLDDLLEKAGAENGK